MFETGVATVAWLSQLIDENRLNNDFRVCLLSIKMNNKNKSKNNVLLKTNVNCNSFFLWNSWNQKNYYWNVLKVFWVIYRMKVTDIFHYRKIAEYRRNRILYVTQNLFFFSFRGHWVPWLQNKLLSASLRSELLH